MVTKNVTTFLLDNVISGYTTCTDKSHAKCNDAKYNNLFTNLSLIISNFIDVTDLISSFSDTDECANNPCNQFCTNTNGGYVCHCHKGYELQGNTNCVGRIRDDIYRILKYAFFFIFSLTGYSNNDTTWL